MDIIHNGYQIGTFNEIPTWEYLGNTFLKPIFDNNWTLHKEYKINHNPNETIEDAGHWHNDANSGFQSNINIYLDEAIVEFRGGLEEVSLRVKPMQYVWFNQNPKFQHRAIPVLQTRRIICFEFNHEFI